jgi:hypothetical protein
VSSNAVFDAYFISSFYLFLLLLNFTDIIKELRKVTFSNYEFRLITAWVSGLQMNIQFERDYNKFLDAVAQSFQMMKCRVYVLRSPDFSWKDRIQLTVENFEAFLDRKGEFDKSIIKVYVCDGDNSPESSPLHRDGQESQASQSTTRSGQREFSESLFKRDKGACVFCCTSGGQLEGAHLLPYEQRHLLDDPQNCAKFEIGSIMDTRNGVLLCFRCHKCFDANLVCINSENNRLTISDALMHNENDKWKDLVDSTIRPALYAWPSKELLKYREEAMRIATQARHDKQEQYILFCKYLQLR